MKIEISDNAYDFELGYNEGDKCQTLKYKVKVIYGRNFAGEGNEFSTTQEHGEEIDLPN